MLPIDENRDDALIFTGIGSLFTAIAAVLLRLPGVRHHFRIFQRVRGRRSIAKRVGTPEIIRPPIPRTSVRGRLPALAIAIAFHQVQSDDEHEPRVTA